MWAWRSGGEQLVKARRTELRRIAANVIEASRKAAHVQVEQQLLFRTTLWRSADGRALVERLALMPPIEVKRIEQMLEQEGSR